MLQCPVNQISAGADSVWAFCSRLLWLKNMHSPQYWSILCQHNHPGRDSVCCRGNHQLQRASWGRRTVREHHHILGEKGKQNKSLTLHITFSEWYFTPTSSWSQWQLSKAVFCITSHYKTNAIGKCWIVQRPNTKIYPTCILQPATATCTRLLCHLATTTLYLKIQRLDPFIKQNVSRARGVCDIY